MDAPFTERENAAFGTNSYGDRVVATAGSYSASWTLSATGANIAGGAAFYVPPEVKITYIPAPMKARS